MSLARFHEVQCGIYAQALAELEQGHKRSLSPDARMKAWMTAVEGYGKPSPSSRHCFPAPY